MLVYGVLYLEVDDERIVGEGTGKGRTVFDGVRGWWGNQMGGIEEQGYGRGDASAAVSEQVQKG